MKKNNYPSTGMRYILLILVMMLPFICPQVLSTSESRIMHIKITDMNGHPVRGLEIVLRPGLLSTITFTNITGNDGKTTIVINSTHSTYYYEIIHPFLGILYEGKITLNKKLTKFNLTIPYEILDLRVHVFDEYLNNIDCVGKLYYKDKLVLINRTIKGVLQLNGSAPGNAPLLLGNNIAYRLLLELNGTIINETLVDRKISTIILDLHPPRILSNKTTVHYKKQTSLVEIVSLINVTDGVFTNKIRGVEIYYKIVDIEKNTIVSSIKAKTSIIRTVSNNVDSYRVYKAKSRLFGGIFSEETTYRIHIDLKVIDYSGKYAYMSYSKLLRLETIIQKNISATKIISPVTTTTTVEENTSSYSVAFGISKKNTQEQGVSATFIFYLIAPIISAIIVVYEIITRQKR